MLFEENIQLSYDYCLSGWYDDDCFYRSSKISLYSDKIYNATARLLI
jgi:hypothetical protein